MTTNAITARVTVSGSFHRHFIEVQGTVERFKQLGCQVLSPSEPVIVEATGDFLFVASDRLRSIKLVQRRHFECIASSHLLWVECPDGYTGPSVSAEIGFALAVGTPVFSKSALNDHTLREFVNCNYSPEQAATEVLNAERRSSSILVDPNAAIPEIESLLAHLPHTFELSDPHSSQAHFDSTKRRIQLLLGDTRWTSRNLMH